MQNKKKWFHNIYVQEIAIFIAMFILTMLHEWMNLDTIPSFLKGLAFFIVLYAQAQAHRFFIFPLFLKKKFIIYGVTALIAIFLGGLLLYIVNYKWLNPEIYYEMDIITVIIYHFVICIISTITIMSWFLIRQYVIELEKRSQDQLLLNEMSMKFLHAQLNPHFFFNMLNNLYGVSLSDPKRTPNLIIKLSDLMRYQLENGNKTEVSVMEEIMFIKNYIDLERERIGKRCDIKFKYPENNSQINASHIAPLLLIILIENAFKHSIAVREIWFVHISIELSNNLLTISINNSLPDETLRYKSTGIGLDNIRRRLEILYAGRFDYATSKSEKEYATLLTMQLKSSL
jgi:LytS/YehU family sensor histidine kinase